MPQTLDPAKSETGSRLYQFVADRIASLIDAGTLRPHEKAPSVRHLARQMNLAVGTVLHAYRILESRGRLAARPQSGFYVLPSTRQLPEVRASVPPRRAGRPTVADLVARMGDMVAAPDVVPLGYAVPNPDCLPTRQLNRIASSIARRSLRSFEHYDVPPGCRELRAQVAKLAIEAGCTLSPDDIVTTCGCQEAIGLCLRAAVKPGGVVAVDSPCYYGILQVLEMLGMRAVEIPTDPRHGVELPALKRAIKAHRISACLFVPNCHNPLGFITPEDKKRDLVKLLASHDIPLIEDDTYGDLAYGPRRPGVCKAYDTDGRVMLCSSLSKTLAPGARVGWVAAGRYTDHVKRLKFCNTLATPTLPQLTLAEYLARGAYAHHLRKVRRMYTDQVRVMTDAIQRHFPAGTCASRPAGGHVLWLELPRAFDSMHFFDRAAAMKISIAPGPLFSTSGGYTNCIRLNCSCPPGPRLEEAIRTLGRLAHEQLTA